MIMQAKTMIMQAKRITNTEKSNLTVFVIRSLYISLSIQLDHIKLFFIIIIIGLECLTTLSNIQFPLSSFAPLNLLQISRIAFLIPCDQIFLFFFSLKCPY